MRARVGAFCFCFCFLQWLSKVFSTVRVIISALKAVVPIRWKPAHGIEGPAVLLASATCARMGPREAPAVLSSERREAHSSRACLRFHFKWDTVFF